MINKGNIKLPDNYQLRRHLSDGMTPAQIAERYGCARDTVRSRIQRAGLRDLLPPVESNRKSMMPPPAKPGIELTSRKVVFTGDYLGSMSLPRLSMHVAALRAAGRITSEAA